MTPAVFYRFYCDFCGYNKVSEGGKDYKDLLEYNRHPIQRSIPKYDPKTKKTTTAKPINQPRQFKCPGCGRLIQPRKIDNALLKHEKGNDDANNPNKPT